jgi:hypothetical protein
MTTEGITNTNEFTVKELVLRLGSAQSDALVAAEEMNSQRFRAQDDAREAADKRYEQRFIAQETAVASALLAQKESTAAALVAADRAVNKAEIAADLRYSALSVKLDVLGARYENSSGSFVGSGSRSAALVNYLLSGLAIAVSMTVGIIFLVKG